FRLVLASLIEEPLAVAAGELRGFDVETTEFPVIAGLLEDWGEHGSAPRRIRVHEDDGILSRRQAIEDEGRATGWLSVPVEDATPELGMLVRSGILGIQQEQRLHVGLCAGEVLLTFLDRVFDSGEIGSETGNRVLPQRR